MKGLLSDGLNTMEGSFKEIEIFFLLQKVWEVIVFKEDRRIDLCRNDRILLDNLS